MFVKTEFVKETINRRDPKENMDAKEAKLNNNAGRHELKVHRNMVLNNVPPTLRTTRLQTPKPLSAMARLETPDNIYDDKLILETNLKSSFLASNESWTSPNELNKNTIDRALVIATNCD